MCLHGANLAELMLKVETRRGRCCGRRQMVVVMMVGDRSRRVESMIRVTMVCEQEVLLHELPLGLVSTILWVVNQQRS